MPEDIVDRFNRKPSGGSGIEGMESVVATVSGYHGMERFNLIKLISQTGANYVGTMSKSTTHLVCWRLEGKKYSLAKKFKTLIVSPKWFEDCAKLGKRVPEDAYLMKCGEEVGPIQFKRLLKEKENLQTRTLDNILADENDRCGNYKKSKNEFRASNGWKSTPSVSCSLEQDTSPVTHLSLGCAMSNQKNSKERQTSKNHSKVLRMSDLVGDKDQKSSAPNCQPSHTRKRDTAHNNFNGTSVETPSRAQRLVKKKVTTLIESDLSDSDQDCYVVGTSRHELGANEEQVDMPIDLSPQKINLPIHSATDVINCHGNLNGDTNQSNQTTTQPISAEPSCAICWTDFSLTRGILPCGHRYCYPCIQSWSDQLISKGMVSTCPLCKENFHSILKVDDAAASDQKVYSQTIPCTPLMRNVTFLPDHGLSGNRTQFLTSQACYVCCSSEPEELLVSCHVCQIRRIHEYCLDPPLFPWVCVHCHDLRNVFHRG